MAGAEIFERRFTAYATVSGWFSDKDFLQLIYTAQSERYGTDTGLLPSFDVKRLYNADGTLYFPLPLRESAESSSHGPL